MACSITALRLPSMGRPDDGPLLGSIEDDAVDCGRKGA